MSDYTVEYRTINQGELVDKVMKDEDFRDMLSKIAELEIGEGLGFMHLVLRSAFPTGHSQMNILVNLVAMTAMNLAKKGHEVDLLKQLLENIAQAMGENLKEQASRADQVQH